MSPRVTHFFAPILLIAIAGSAEAGAVRGTVWMNRKAAATAKTSSHPATLAKHQRGVTEAVVYVEKIPEVVERRLSGRGWTLFRKTPKEYVPRIVQKDRMFRPRVLAVSSGTRVEFLNLDRVYHNAFSVSSAKRFDLGKHPPGRSDTVQFDRPGVVNLHDDIHADMVGFIVVTPNHAYVRPDSLGRFALPKLPPGPYTIRVWHPGKPEVRREVVMPKRGDLLLDLAL